jgi:RNA polymerase sigma-70 factor, ECF subfamily
MPVAPQTTPTEVASARSPSPTDGVVTLRIIASQLDDAALVSAAQRGDRNALDQLLRRHYDRLHAVCRRIAGSSRDADDACQEALIKIVRNLPRFDAKSSFGTWAYRIATNAALDELRKRDRTPKPVLDDHDDRRRETPDDRAHQPMDQLGDRLVLDAALAELPDDLRAAVVLRDVAHLDYAEIAEVLDVPVGTVKSRISRGRAALAQRLRIDLDVPLSPGLSPDPGNRTHPDERPTDST